MLSAKELKFLQSLQQKKERDVARQFLVDNPKVISENISSKYFKKLYLSTEVVAKYQSYWPKANYQTISNSELKKIAPSSTPQGVVAVFDFLAVKKFAAKSPLVLLLDGIQDPGNIGTILRSADWFGVTDIFLNNTCADIYNPKTIASSMGSIFNVNCYRDQDLVAIAIKLKKSAYQLLAADSHAKGASVPKGKKAVIIGSEARGVSPELLALADQRYVISGQGKAESLNAAVAASIILYQLSK